MSAYAVAAEPPKSWISADGYVVLKSTAIEFRSDQNSDVAQAVLWKIGNDNDAHIADRTTLLLLKAMSEHCGLKSIDFNGAQLNSEALRVLPMLSKVEELVFNCCNIDDDTVAKLNKHGLKVLGLFGTKVTDAGIKNIDIASSLVVLDLGKTGVTDSCMKVIGSLKTLQRLGLAWTSVGDRDLSQLRRLHDLLSLELMGTKVSDKEIALLRHFQPQCQITRYQWGDTYRAHLLKVSPGTLPSIYPPWPLVNFGSCGICEVLVIESVRRGHIRLDASLARPGFPKEIDPVPTTFPDLCSAIKWKEGQPRAWENGRRKPVSVDDLFRESLPLKKKNFHCVSPAPGAEKTVNEHSSAGVK